MTMMMMFTRHELWRVTRWHTSLVDSQILNNWSHIVSFSRTAHFGDSQPLSVTASHRAGFAILATTGLCCWRSHIFSHILSINLPRDFSNIDNTLFLSSNDTLQLNLVVAENLFGTRLVQCHCDESYIKESNMLLNICVLLCHYWVTEQQYYTMTVVGLYL